MDKDADFDEERQNCSLLIALKHGASKGVVQLLLSEGADPNACREDGMSALMIGLHGGASKEVVGLLLTSGADANPEEQERAATLMDALAAGLSKDKVEAANVEEPELEMRSNDNSPPSLVDDIVAGRGSRKGSMDLARALQTLGRLRQSLLVETPKVPAPRTVSPEPRTPPQQPRGRGLLSRPTPVNSPQSRFLAHSRRASLEPDVLL
jgi:ankyrin repeat protein